MEIVEYDYYEFTLSVTIATQRPEAAPSGILVAASMHEEFAARVRKVLREFRHGLDAYMPYYRAEKMQPAGSAREIQNNYDLTRLQYAGGLALLDAAKVGDERVVFAFERNIEKACQDLFEANQIPHVFIPGEEGVLGDSFIQVLCTMGGATNIGQWNVAPE